MAWDVARESGLAALSLREIARRLGMASPSLYGYFESKDALYDAMFAEGYRDLLALQLPPAETLRDALADSIRLFVGFCLDDPVRYQLLFQRTVPGFEPSPESYALAVEALQRDVDALARLGVTSQEDIDLVTAVVSGLVSQQLANDPGGTRWVRLVDRVADMLAVEIAERRDPPHRPAPPRRPRRRPTPSTPRSPR